jgi:hypothetical protein
MKSTFPPTDATLFIGSLQVPVHRFVLAYRSTHFARAFYPEDASPCLKVTLPEHKAAILLLFELYQSNTLSTEAHLTAVWPLVSAWQLKLAKPILRRLLGMRTKLSPRALLDLAALLKLHPVPGVDLESAQSVLHRAFLDRLPTPPEALELSIPTVAMLARNTAEQMQLLDQQRALLKLEDQFTSELCKLSDEDADGNHNQGHTADMANQWAATFRPLLLSGAQQLSSSGEGHSSALIRKGKEIAAALVVNVEKNQDAALAAELLQLYDHCMLRECLRNGSDGDIASIFAAVDAGRLTLTQDLCRAAILERRPVQHSSQGWMSAGSVRSAPDIHHDFDDEDNGCLDEYEAQHYYDMQYF